MRLINKFFKKVFLKFVVLIGLGVCLFSLNALAFEWGEAEITPNFALSESYDDNVSYTSRNEKSDFITKICPGVDVRYDAKDFRWDMYADITQEIFARNSTFNNTSEHIKFKGDVELSKHDRLSLSEKFAHTYEPVSFEQAFARTLGRYSYYANDIEVEYIRDLTRQLSIHASYANELDLLSRDDMSDSVLHKLAVQLDYVFSSAITYSTELMFARRDFDPGSNTDQLRWDAALKYNFSRLTDIKFTAGYDNFFTPQKDYARPVFIVSFDHEIGKTVEANITLKKQYELNSYSQELFDCWRASSFMNYHFTPKITGGVGVYYGQGTYVQSRVDETFIGSEISSEYALARDTTLNCTYAYTQNKSNDADREYTKNSVSCGFRKQF